MWSFKSAGCSVLLAVDPFKFVCGCFVGGGVDAEVSVLVLLGWLFPRWSDRDVLFLGLSFGVHFLLFWCKTNNFSLCFFWFKFKTKNLITGH